MFNLKCIIDGNYSTIHAYYLPISVSIIKYAGKLAVQLQHAIHEKTVAFFDQTTVLLKNY